MNLAALRSSLSRLVGDSRKRAVRSKLNEARKWFAGAMLSYDGEKLKGRLRGAGVAEGDTLLVHANFKPDSGFQGTPLDLANAFAGLVGSQGNLLMVSIPFRGAACDHLALGKPFNVRKTMSMMGLVTEMFRRREGTLRSLHPTHPVLAYGRDAAFLVADHERCLHPCGAGSPFEKFHRLRGKILFFDVSLHSITFFHYVEDLLKERLPFSVYDDRLFSVPVIDAGGASHLVRTYAFSTKVRRMAGKLEAELELQGKVRRGKVGNSRFSLVTAEDVVACFTSMVEKGNLPYELVKGMDGRGQGDNE